MPTPGPEEGTGFHVQMAKEGAPPKWLMREDCWCSPMWLCSGGCQTENDLEIGQKTWAKAGDSEERWRMNAYRQGKRSHLQQWGRLDLPSCTPNNTGGAWQQPRTTQKQRNGIEHLGWVFFLEMTTWLVGLKSSNNFLQSFIKDTDLQGFYPRVSDSVCSGILKSLL